MNILIVEDEKSIANRIKRLSQEILGSRTFSISIKPSVSEALEHIENHKIDLLFLDLNLSGTSGFDVLKQVLAEPFNTIIVSAYKDKAIEAFDYGVTDFVAKPFTKERLEKAMNRAMNNGVRASQASQNIVIKKQGKIVLIPVSEIVYVKGANIYSEIHLANGKKDLSDKTLDHLLKLLPAHFERIHKSYIIDMNRSTEIIIQPGSKYKLILNDGLELPLGRTKYKYIKETYFS